MNLLAHLLPRSIFRIFPISPPPVSPPPAACQPCPPPLPLDSRLSQPYPLTPVLHADGGAHPTPHEISGDIRGTPSLEPAAGGDNSPSMAHVGDVDFFCASPLRLHFSPNRAMMATFGEFRYLSRSNSSFEIIWLYQLAFPPYELQMDIHNFSIAIVILPCTMLLCRQISVLCLCFWHCATNYALASRCATLCDGPSLLP